ncbi:hypothetical protein L3X38_021931 [Prunus dulcis]|uniref:SKP1 component POZ domain-containing protein n=1 Tax=Prunus dulcis TaxID=3755 RepID=A0AAD4VV02_PRUDU|nr:hypothetical protein L3X38_021931 [Prunus dulcis]
MSSSKSRVFRLRCLNDEIIEVNEAAAVLCETIKNMVEEGCEGDEISVPNVTAEILGKVMEWCKKHAKGKETKEELKSGTLSFLMLIKQFCTISSSPRTIYTTRNWWLKFLKRLQI